MYDFLETKKEKMKKILGILVLGLLWCDIGFAKSVQFKGIEIPLFKDKNLIIIKKKLDEYGAVLKIKLYAEKTSDNKVQSIIITHSCKFEKYQADFMNFFTSYFIYGKSSIFKDNGDLNIYFKKKKGYGGLSVRDMDLEKYINIKDSFLEIKDVIKRLKAEYQLEIPKTMLRTDHLYLRLGGFEWIVYMHNYSNDIEDISHIDGLSKFHPKNINSFPNHISYMNNWINLSLARHKEFQEKLKIRNKATLDFTGFNEDKDIKFYKNKFYSNKELIAQKKTEEEKKKKELIAQKKTEEEKKKKELLAQKKAEEEKKKKELLAQKKAEEEKKKKELLAQKKAEEKRIVEEKIKEKELNKKLSLIPQETVLQKAQAFIENVQAFIKIYRNEFDIIKISEFFIATKEVLNGNINQEIKNNLDSFKEYTDTSNKFRDYEIKYYKEVREKALKYVDNEIILLKNGILKLENFLIENSSSTYFPKALKLAKSSKKTLDNPKNLSEISYANELIKDLFNEFDEVKGLLINVLEQISVLENYLSDNLTINSAPQIIEEIKFLRNLVKKEDLKTLRLKKNSAKNFINSLNLN